MIDLIAAFHAKMAKHRPNFYVYGLLTQGDRLYPLGTDTKVLSTAFELIARPLIHELADDAGLTVHEPDAQTVYPDFTLMHARDDPAKLAVDVKSAYRHFDASGGWRTSFTLGSYTSFLRNGTKNITFPFVEYAKHYIVGFIYTRMEKQTSEHIYPLGQRSSVPCPIKDVEYFVQEKYRIAGERPGSGNTANIGSIIGSHVKDFATGNGPFANRGEDVFVDYWCHYDRSRATRPYDSLAGYDAWRRQNP